MPIQWHWTLPYGGPIALAHGAGPDDAMLIKLGIYHRQTGWLLRDGEPGLFARHVLLHEMIHQFLRFTGRNIRHASRDWCAEIMRIGPELGIAPFQSEPSRVTKVRLEDGKRVSKRVTGGDWTMPMIATFPSPAFDYDTETLRPEFAASRIPTN